MTNGSRPAAEPGAADEGARALRLFVALTPAPDVQRALGEAAAPLVAAAGPAARPVAPHALHLTLRFLGDTAPERVPGLSAALGAAAAAGAPLTLAVAGAGAFPTLARAQVLWLGLGANAQLDALYARVAAACAGEGFGREARRFRAHLTVARVKRGATIDREAFAAAVGAVEYPAPFVIGALDLVASTLAPGGARHEVVGRWGLGTRPREDVITNLYAQ